MLRSEWGVGLGLMAVIAIGACSSDAVDLGADTAPPDTSADAAREASVDDAPDDAPDGANPRDAGAADSSTSDGDAEAPLEGGAPVVLFDGVLGPDWKMTTIRNQPGHDDPGHFDVVDGALVMSAGTDLGLLWNTQPTPADFLLELEWRLGTASDNSGVFIRFPDPESKGYDNTAFVPVDFGFEVQIDEQGYPDGLPMHTTGSIYSEPVQTFTRVVAHGPGEWNAFAIRAVGNVFTVMLNGQQVTRFENLETDAGRGLPSTPTAPSFIGLQTHAPGNVAFRNIRITAL